jgi:excisionase family DNA binding protein
MGLERCHDGAVADLERFLTLPDVAELLSTSVAQVYAMVRREELPAIKIGGRGQWRVSEDDLNEYVRQQRVATKKYIEEHPFDPADQPEDADR